MLTSLQERERAAEDEDKREHDIARGNPLLNPQDFNIKRRWDDDVVFKNQARGTEERRDKEFVNVGHFLPFLIARGLILISSPGYATVRLSQEIYGKRRVLSVSVLQKLIRIQSKYVK